MLDPSVCPTVHWIIAFFISFGRHLSQASMVPEETFHLLTLLQVKQAFWHLFRGCCILPGVPSVLWQDRVTWKEGAWPITICLALPICQTRAPWKGRPCIVSFLPDCSIFQRPWGTKAGSALYIYCPIYTKLVKGCPAKISEGCFYLSLTTKEVLMWYKNIYTGGRVGRREPKGTINSAYHSN